MRKGFTLIELILVVSILGILAVSALPRFINVSTDASIAARDGVVAAVRTGIALQRAEAMVTPGSPGTYPQWIDNGIPPNTVCSETNPCFVGILSEGVTSSDWTHVDNFHYTYSDGTTTTTYTYDPVNGTFTSSD